MLKLTANSNTLNISKATNFNLTLKSPLAGEAGSYVFSLSVPYEENAWIFGFPSRLTRMEVQKASVPGAICWQTKHIQKGLWQAKSSTDKIINLEMIIGRGHFNTLVDGKNLPEYFDVEAYSGSAIVTHVDATVLDTYPDVNHQFPCILNNIFYEDKNTFFSGVLNDYANGFIGDEINYTTIVPQLYLFYVIKYLFTSNSYTPFGSVFDDEYLKKALLYNNYAIDELISIYFHGEAVNMLVASTYEILWDTNINDPENNYTEATGKYEVTSPGVYQIDSNITCKLDQIPSGGTAPYFIKLDLYYNGVVIDTHTQIAHTPTTNTDLTIEHLETIAVADINHDMYATLYYIDSLDAPFSATIVEGDISIINQDSPERNIFGTKINYKNHVPDMDVKTFLNAIYNAFKIMPFFDHTKKTVELVFFQDMLQSTKQHSLENGLVKNTFKNYGNDYEGLKFSFDFQGPDDNIQNDLIIPETITGTVDIYFDLPYSNAVGDIFYVTSLNAYYKYTYIEPEEPEEGDPEVPGTYEWLPYSDKHPDVIYNDGNTPVTTSLAPMLMRCHRHPDSYLLRNMPSIEATGTSEPYKLQNDFPLRIMFYTGLSQIGETTEYPLASTTATNTEGDTILPINYTWDDLITRYWIPVIAWYKRRQKIEFTNIVSPTFIANLDFQNKFYFQKTKVLFSEVIVNIKNKIFGAGKFKGWG